MWNSSRLAELRDSAGTNNWEDVLVLYCQRAKEDDFKMTRMINNLCDKLGRCHGHLVNCRDVHFWKLYYGLTQFDLFPPKTSRYSSVPSTPPSYSSGPSTPQIYSPGSSRNAECSNCKELRGRISVLKATMEMHMHPEQHILNLAALLHEVLNEMEKLDLE
ncbi:hypothetical protein Tco_0239832 [Tanacetum coccineum]